MRNTLKIILSGILATTVVACSFSPKPSYDPVKVTWDNSKPIKFDADSKSKLPANMANLVFLREQDRKNEQTAVNVGVNDRYQTSVRGGNYTTLPICAGGTKISTAITLKKLNDLSFNSNIFDFAPAENYFFEITVSEAGDSHITKLSETEALERLENKELQTHMVNRTQAKNCAPYETRQPDPVPIQIPNERQKLFGVYYFDFDIPTMNAVEKQRAYNLGKKVLATGSSYEVYLSGHADPMGESDYNSKLSRKRAVDVAKVLESAGIDPTKIKLGSFGEQKPILLQCQGIKVRQARNGCNLKNRRVEALIRLDGITSTMEDVDTIR